MCRIQGLKIYKKLKYVCKNRKEFFRKHLQNLFLKMKKVKLKNFAKKTTKLKIIPVGKIYFRGNIRNQNSKKLKNQEGEISTILFILNFLKIFLAICCSNFYYRFSLFTQNAQSSKRNLPMCPSGCWPSGCCCCCWPSAIPLHTFLR